MIYIGHNEWEERKDTNRDWFREESREAERWHMKEEMLHFTISVLVFHVRHAVLPQKWRRYVHLKYRCLPEYMSSPQSLPWGPHIFRDCWHLSEFSRMVDLKRKYKTLSTSVSGLIQWEYVKQKAWGVKISDIEHLIWRIRHGWDL
jgi:hypothetical protein